MAKLKLPFELEKPSSNEYVTQASEIGYGDIPAACGLVYDISVAHAVSNVPAQYVSLTAALGTSGANIPQDVRRGGMAVKFINSGTGKYEQWVLKASSFSTTESDWMCVTDVNAEDVSYGNSNVKEELDKAARKFKEDNSGKCEVVDENGNVAFAIDSEGVKARWYYLCDSSGNKLLKINKSLFDGLQTKLVSGESIATINGRNLLEGGDIVIESGGGGGSADGVVEDNTGVFRVVDKSQNVAFAIDSEGVKARWYYICNEQGTIVDVIGKPKNKTIAIIGDSWTDQSGTYGNWIGKYKDAVKVKQVKVYGVGGAHFTFSEDTVEDLNDATGGPSVVSANNVFWNQVNRIKRDVNNHTIDSPDVIFLMGDTNDRSKTIGSVSSAFAVKDISGYTSSQLTNFAISVRYTIEEIIRSFPTCKIIVSTPAYLYGDSAANYNDMLQEVCEYMGVECLRADKNSGINVKYQATNGDEFAAIYLNNGLDIHLNQNGADLLAKFIIANTINYIM